MFGLMYEQKKEKCKILSYDDFLMNVDEKSKNRLRELDVAIEAYRGELEKEGFAFDECSCVAQGIKILRNQFGFYVDETSSLDSKEAYTIYQCGLNFYYEFSKKFNVLHRILQEKEYIMNGNYLCKRGIRADMDFFSASLGYGISRQKRIYEEMPEHPSMEYQRLVIMLEVINDSDSCKKDDIIERCMEKLKEHLLPRYRIEVKRVKDKYNRDFDNSCGVLVVDKTLGEMEMVYEFDGLNISKNPYNKYFMPNKPYIDIYMRIIAYCLKDELLYEFSEKKDLI